ncbi:MAG: hypothetical protein MJE68_00980 [Proteobacteria bacterium]|nr:hypothetical protein [Pseudomonadota bacterium]
MAEMKTLLISSLGDMKREIQTIKSDVYAKKKRKVLCKSRAPCIDGQGFPAHQPK